jgi:succinyl-CoA synthetase beta subunit
MYLLEHDAKELLAQHGISVPHGRLIGRNDTMDRHVLPAGPWMVKGQIAAGGRGKIGLVKKAESWQEISAQLDAMLGAVVGGGLVGAVRVEQQVKAAHEAYIGFLLDAASGGVRVILSDSGGMDVEQVPRDRIHSAIAAPEVRDLVECVRKLAVNLPGDISKAVVDAGEKLVPAFLELEAVLVEINPLFVLESGGWIAGDAKVITDDNALPRQRALESLIKTRAADYADVARKHEHGFDYVEVDPTGEIGLLTTGAGLSMMLIDELRAAGLKPFNFLDIRTGGLRGETKRLTQVLQWIGAGEKVKVLLVNIFAGITDLGEFSRLLVTALETAHVRMPVVARLVGTNLASAREVLATADIPLHTDLDAAIAEVRQHLAGKTRNG